MLHTTFGANICWLNDWHYFLFSAIQRPSLSTLSKAFSKSTKTRCKSERYSALCSMIVRSMLMWSTKHIKKKYVVNDFRHQKMLLKCSETLFWSCLNRSGKMNTNYGRTSKHSEYGYAKKGQTFQWKSQIVSISSFLRVNKYCLKSATKLLTNKKAN